MTASTRARPGTTVQPHHQQRHVPPMLTAPGTPAAPVPAGGVASPGRGAGAGIGPRKALQSRRMSQQGGLAPSNSPGDADPGKDSTTSPATVGSVIPLATLTTAANNTITNNNNTGAVNIDPTVVDALPHVAFPKRGFPLHPLDAADPLLVMCAKAIAACANRALTPKELALICARRYGWSCEGSQPFAVVSAAIRSHLRRAATANPPYLPIFSTYELSSVIPAEDVPCVGIEPESRPVVKRGTFWFLAENVGFQSPFPHRPSTTMHPQALGSGTKQKTSTITLSFLSQSKPKNEEKPLTRAQANARPVEAEMETADESMQMQMQEDALGYADGLSDPLGRGKRKRTASTMAISTADKPPVAPHASISAPTPILPAPLTSSSQPTTITTTSTHPSHPSSTPSAVGDNRKTRQMHRRAFSSGAQDSLKPGSGLKKLKFRLSNLPEAVAIDPSAPSNTSTAVPTPTTARPISASTKSSSSSSSVSKAANKKALASSIPGSAQPHPKRARTQSMSVLQHPSLTAAFPFDNLHLHLSAQQQPQGGLQPHHSHSHDGTLFPFEMHNLLSASTAAAGHSHASQQHALDLLTSRSAPEHPGIFSPPTSSPFISGPFSRRSTIAGLAASSASASASASMGNASSAASAAARTGHRSLPPEDSFASDVDDSKASTPGAGAGDEYDSLDVSAAAYDGWASAPTNPNGPQRDLLSGTADFHEAMLKNDLEFAFDFSLDSLETSTQREESDGTVIEGQSGTRQGSHLSDHHQHAVDEDVEEVAASALDLTSLSDDVDGIFEGMSSAAAALGSESMDEDAKLKGGDGENITEKSVLAGEALQMAMNMTLCPAASKYADIKPGRLLARRMNSSSSLVFSRSSQGDARPVSLSRANSRDVLNTPIPLAELPGLSAPGAIENPIFLYSGADMEQELEDAQTEISGPRTPVIKAEEDGDEFADLGERRRLSRSMSRISQASSADSFVPETIYARASTADDEEPDMGVSRSQTSSRVSSLSPRDSFSPQASGPNADWALTPPSEEEHMEDEEKSLDRATLLGPESVGMDDLDDAWPGSRNPFACSSTGFDKHSGAASVRVAEVEVFEPVLSPGPMPEAHPAFSGASRQSSAPPLAAAKADDSGIAMGLDDTDMIDLDENAAAAMFIADDPNAPAMALGADSIGASALSSASADDAMADVSTSSSLSDDKTPTMPAADSVAGSESTQMAIPEAPASGQAEGLAPTQSFLFYPETPFTPGITILLTDTKILFYSTIVVVAGMQRPLLRRVDNDAVDGEALLLSLQGATDKDKEREDTFKGIKELGNTWVALDYARELLSKFGGENPPLETFLADDILLSWNEKLVRLGTMLRQRNGLATPVNKPVSVEHKKKVAAAARAAKKVSPNATAAKASSPPAIPAKPLSPVTIQPKEVVKPATPASAKEKKGEEHTSPASAVTKRGRAASGASRRSTRNKHVASS